MTEATTADLVQSLLGDAPSISDQTCQTCQAARRLLADVLTVTVAGMATAEGAVAGRNRRHQQVDMPKDGPGNPMTDSELDDKFIRLPGPVLDAGRPQTLPAAVSDPVTPAADLRPLAAPAPAGMPG